MVQLAIVLEAGGVVLVQVGSAEELVLDLASSLTSRFVARLQDTTQTISGMYESKEYMQLNIFYINQLTKVSIFYGKNLFVTHSVTPVANQSINSEYFLYPPHNVQHFWYTVKASCENKRYHSSPIILYRRKSRRRRAGRCGPRRRQFAVRRTGAIRGSRRNLRKPEKEDNTLFRYIKIRFSSDLYTLLYV